MPVLCRLRLCRPLILLGLLGAAATARASDATTVEQAGVSYGATDDDAGPLGGGPGYQHIASQGDHTASTLDELIAALGKAQAGDVVFIPGETEIDLTARIYVDKLVLEIPAGVTLAGNRGAADSAGAILTSDALDTPVMLRPLGPGVRVTGLRLRGPCPKRYIEHWQRARDQLGPDYREYYYKFPTSNGIVTTHDRLKVDNCEISGFAHAGVHLRAGTGHRVHHCSIHHCQYQGLGYGVCLNTATAKIDHNLFNWNRHSIAGTGRPPCGYEAAHNVELGESLSHCFDMHGGRDRGDGTNTAGTLIEIHHNTFRAAQPAVKIRGKPEDACRVHHNWFVRFELPAKAVVAEAGTSATENAYGPAGEIK